MINALAFLGRCKRLDPLIKLIRDVSQRFVVASCIAQTTNQPRSKPPLEQRREHKHHTVNNRPRKIATKHANEHGAIVRCLQLKPASADEAQRHDQTKYGFAKTINRIKIVSNERSHVMQELFQARS